MKYEVTIYKKMGYISQQIRNIRTETEEDATAVMKWAVGYYNGLHDGHYFVTIYQNDKLITIEEVKSNA